MIKFIIFSFTYLFILVNSSFANINDGLIIFYPFNGNANDESGSNNNGVISAPILTEDRFNQTNSAYLFNGTSDIIRCEFSDITIEDFTVLFWINPLSKKKYNQNILANDGWGSFQFHTDQYGSIYVGTDHISRFSPQDLPNNTLELDKWQFFTYVFSNGEAKFYKNRQLLTSGIHQKPDNWKKFTLGSIQDGDRYSIHGSIDDVRVYTRALTELEILQIYDVDNTCQDFDNDGVPNLLDMCPNTMNNLYTDNKGCPPNGIFISQEQADLLVKNMNEIIIVLDSIGLKDAIKALKISAGMH